MEVQFRSWIKLTYNVTSSVVLTDSDYFSPAVPRRRTVTSLQLCPGSGIWRVSWIRAKPLFLQLWARTLRWLQSSLTSRASWPRWASQTNLFTNTEGQKKLKTFTKKHRKSLCREHILQHTLNRSLSNMFVSIIVNINGFVFKCETGNSENTLLQVFTVLRLPVLHGV